MTQVDPNLLGLILVGVGLLVLVVTLGLTRFVPKLRLTRPPELPVFQPDSLDPHADAVLTVHLGGQVTWVNARAREIFQLQEGELPNLERLAKKFRPSEKFLGLCAAEGQARFVFDGRPADGISYRVQAAQEPYLVLSLRLPEVSGELVDQSSVLQAKTLQTFTELTQAIAASLDLDETLQAILENVEKLVPADIWEITIWDSQNELFIPYRMVGQQGVERKLESTRERYLADQGYTGYLYRERKPLLVKDVETYFEVRPVLDRKAFPMRSYLGVPLVVGQQFIGTLELASLSVDFFQQGDRDLVNLISGQAAIALHNALLYRHEKRRAIELSGLAQLAQAFSAVRDQRGMFERLVNSIIPLIHVRILGFVLYNENTRQLEGQTPFHGLPPQFMEIYRIPIPAGSRLEQVFLDQDVIITENASEDSRWQELGLNAIASAASLKDTVLVPLTSGGRMLGYLQVSNHLDGSQNFTQDELHFLMIIANQAAPIIENAALVQQSRSRAQRAEALRRIASLVSSSATLDEILKYSLQELARLLNADLAAAFLLDRNRTALYLHRASRYGEPGELTERSARLLVDDAQFPFSVTGSQRGFRLGQEPAEKPLIPYYQQLITNWQIQSVLAVPLIVRDEGIGEIWICRRRPQDFDLSDMQVMSTAGGQLAGVVEQAYLSAQTDDTLRRRVDQMTALTRITRELSTSLDLSYLLQLVYDEAVRTTRASCGTILMFDLSRPEGESPRIRFYVGDKPNDECSALELRVLSSGETKNIADLSQEEVHGLHDGIRSALWVPIIYQQRAAGLIVMHGTIVQQFDDSAVEIAQSLAAQAAIAFGNAIQYEEQARRGELLKRQIDTLSRLFQVSNYLRPEQPLEKALEAIGQAIREATSFQVSLISVYDPQVQGLRRVAGVGIAAEVWEELRSRIQPWRSIQHLLQPKYKIGNAYFIPIDEEPLIPEDVHTVTILPSTETLLVDAWDPDDILIVPLYNGAGELLGLISLDDPRDGRRPDQPAFDALEIFASQAALVIDYKRYTNQLSSRLAVLEEETSRLERSLRNTQQNLPVVLHRQIEQTVENQRLFRRVERVRAGLEMTERATLQDNVQGVLEVIGQEIMARLDMSLVLVAEQTPVGPRLISVLGTAPDHANPEALFGQRNPLRQVLQDGRMLLISNLEETHSWKNSPLLNAVNAHSFLALPFKISEGCQAGVLVLGSKVLSPFSEEDHQVYAQLSRQVSVSLQNLELLRETRRHLDEVNLLLDFSRKLGSLEPGSILAALMEAVMQVISSATTGWVGLYEDSTRQLVPLKAAGYVSPDSILEIRYAVDAVPAPLPVRVLMSGQPDRDYEVNFAEDYLLPPDDLIRYRNASNGKLPVSSLVVPIRLGERGLGVLVLENEVINGAFSAEDEALTLSLAQQAALALENARLFQATEQRTGQLQALTQVSGRMTSSLSSQQLIASMLEQLKPVVEYDTATLWLRENDLLSIASAAGFSDNESRLGISVRVEDSLLFQEMIRTAQPLAVADIREDMRFPSLLEPEYFSWLGIPLLAKSELIGAIALEKREAGFYTPDNVQLATTFAGQVAVSLDNARLYEESLRRAAELDQRSNRLALLNRLSRELSSSLDLSRILRVACEQLAGALEVARAAAILPTEGSSYTLLAEEPSSGLELPYRFDPIPLFEALQESQGIYNTDRVTEESGLQPLVQSYLAQLLVKSLLIVPLIAGQEVQGWLVLQSTEERRFNPAEIELARTIGNQTSITLQNARLFDETRRLKEDLEQRVEERTAELSREHHNSQTMLRITTELSASLDIKQVLSRTLSVINQALGAEESLILLAQGSTVYQSGLSLTAFDAVQPPERSVERLIHRFVARQRSPIWVDDIHSDGRWEIPAESQPAFQSVLSVPLILGEEVLGTLNLYHRKAAQFKSSQVALLETIARQIGITLNNAELFNLIRDQAENLGSMLRDQQIEASRSRAILEAVADGVVVTDASLKITLFNASAEKILGVRVDQIIGQPLERFSGVFGKSGKTWMETIQNWSQDATAYQMGETYADTILLDNDQVVAIHLAPVFWRNGFLGTVTIFRDITHQVQVDRMKSEFITNVSHELRTPLTSIKGYVDILLMGAGGQVTAQQVHFLNVVKENTQKLHILVDDLLDISRVESGKEQVTLQAVDLPEIIETVVKELRDRSVQENRPMTFAVEIPEHLPKAFGDRVRIQQVLRALALNGYNYTPENGTVKVRASRSAPETLQLDVIDNGIGISAEVQPRIFERFYRGEDPLVMRTSGTGLGLALSKILVEMMNGRIWFTSSGIPGEGSVFSFTLPKANLEE